MTVARFGFGTLESDYSDSWSTLLFFMDERADIGSRHRDYRRAVLDDLCRRSLHESLMDLLDDDEDINELFRN